MTAPFAARAFRALADTATLRRPSPATSSVIALPAGRVTVPSPAMTRPPPETRPPSIATKPLSALTNPTWEAASASSPVDGDPDPATRFKAGDLLFG
jgi:hypothetical protein